MDAFMVVYLALDKAMIVLQETKKTPYLMEEPSEELGNDLVKILNIIKDIAETEADPGETFGLIFEYRASLLARLKAFEIASDRDDLVEVVYQRWMNNKEASIGTKKVKSRSMPAETSRSTKSNAEGKKKAGFGERSHRSGANGEAAPIEKSRYYTQQLAISRSKSGEVTNVSDFEDDKSEDEEYTSSSEDGQTGGDRGSGHGLQTPKSSPKQERWKGKQNLEPNEKEKPARNVKAATLDYSFSARGESSSQGVEDPESYLDGDQFEEPGSINGRSSTMPATQPPPYTPATPVRSETANFATPFSAYGSGYPHPVPFVPWLPLSPVSPTGPGLANGVAPGSTPTTVTTNITDSFNFYGNDSEVHPTRRQTRR
ncbi:hypothetical protein GALMADRAFT_403194 [Galerina marginata CBS 339.88]|uniref:Uncharacterized protein n=1 Tax=Galerina marginata (strain CBS 339.88) TaxID=685588 RepID=A0A067TSG8_GALM3|nr:hypothetical protein GALMADRAFT_403194 [Galerina marginata CBS 339.88]